MSRSQVRGRVSFVTMPAMGHDFVEAELSWKRAARVRVLVDTGATHSVLPSDLANRLGVDRTTRCGTGPRRRGVGSAGSHRRPAVAEAEAEPCARRPPRRHATAAPLTQASFSRHRRLWY